MTRPTDFPPAVSLDDYLASGQEPHEDWIQVRSPLSSTDLAFDALLRLRLPGAPTLVLMPSAQSREGRRNPVYHRWTWADEFPSANLIALSDPGLSAADDVLGSWFMHTRIDLVREAGNLIRRITGAWQTAAEDVVLYGSSMGGFAALQVSAALPGTRAVAEVPQLTMSNYAYPDALHTIERRLLDTTFARHLSIHPEQISFTARCRYENHTPQFRIVTNRADATFTEALELLRAPAFGSQRMTLDVWPEPIGHAALPQKIMAPLLRQELLGDRSDAETLSPRAQSEPHEAESYEDLVRRGTELAAAVRFVRDEADRKNYEGAVEALLKAADLNPTADFPLRRLCPLMKVWDMSYSPRLYEISRRALERAEGLDTVSYYCRGVLANEPTTRIPEILQDLRNRLESSDLRSIIDIFRAMAIYDSGDLAGYETAVRRIRQELRPGFETYLLVPLSTVMLSDDPEESASPEVGTFLKDLESLELPHAEDTAYSLVVACDPVYLETFAPMLIESFNLTCPDNARLVFIVLGGSAEQDYAGLLGAGANCTFLPCRFPADGNIGPAASLARFLVVPQLLKMTNAPVVVADIDAVVKKDLGGMIAGLGEADIALRVLGDNLAPWERYAAGIVIFTTRPNSLLAARETASGGARVLKPGAPQWWVDQNALEFGIRQVKLQSKQLSLHNLMATSVEYLRLPTGPREAKVEILTKELDRLRATVASSTQEGPLS